MTMIRSGHRHAVEERMEWMEMRVNGRWIDDCAVGGQRVVRVSCDLRNSEALTKTIAARQGSVNEN